MKFNSKLLGVALIPLYLYILISVFVLVNAEFHFEVFNLGSVLLLSIGLLASAICFSFMNRRIQALGLVLMLVLGGIGIYVGLIVDAVNWMELLSSAGLIAFGFAMFEVTRHKGDEE